MFNFFNKKIRENTTRGFTLVEMTIVAAIFGILTTIVVFKYGDFTSSMLVTNMAYEIALTTRQSQAFSVGVRGYELDGERTFENPYGVYFSLNETDDGGAEARNFIFFVDSNGDQICNSGERENTCTCSGTDECLERLTLQRNIRITGICSGLSLDRFNQDTEATVSFKRPNPEAIIVDPSRPGTKYEFVQIRVEAPKLKINPSYVLIRRNGQISVSTNDICNIK